MLTDEELAAVPEELLKDLLRYSEYGWRDRRIVSLLARCYPVSSTHLANSVVCFPASVL